MFPQPWRGGPFAHFPCLKKFPTSNGYETFLNYKYAVFKFPKMSVHEPLSEKYKTPAKSQRHMSISSTQNEVTKGGPISYSTPTPGNPRFLTPHPRPKNIAHLYGCVETPRRPSKINCDQTSMPNFITPCGKTETNNPISIVIIPTPETATAGMKVEPQIPKENLEISKSKEDKRY